MQLIKQIKREGYDQIELFSFEALRWKWQRSFCVAHQHMFFEILSRECAQIDYALLDFNMVYRNTLYYLYPSIHIAIKPSTMQRYVEDLLGEHTSFYEEVAIGLDGVYSRGEISEELRYFVQCFYRCESKEVARAYYEAWQYERALNDQKANKFIRIMEFYQDEIFNYFDYKQTKNGRDLLL